MTAPAALCMGEILIDFIGSPKGAGLAEAASFERKPGGAPANVAVGLRRLGMPSAFIGMVGNDAFGGFLRGVLETEAVDTRALAVCEQQPTTLAFVALDARGVPDFTFYRHPGADLSLRPEDLDMGVFADARIFHFGSLSLTASPARDATMAALALARSRGAFVSYDPNFRPALWPDRETARERMREPLGFVHLLKVSEEEALLISGADSIEAACEALAAAGPKCIIVTRGADGMTAWLDGGAVHEAAVPVEVTDTTGCGDASMAGALVELDRQCGGLSAGVTLRREALQAALSYANRCAALTATRLGAIPALPSADEVAAFQRENPRRGRS